MRFASPSAFALCIALVQLGCATIEQPDELLVNVDSVQEQDTATHTKNARVEGSLVDPHVATPITATSVPRIRKGMTISQLRDAVQDSTPLRYRFLDQDSESLEDWMKVARDLEVPLQHHFTITRDGDVITCVAVQLFDPDRSLKSAFVFRNGTLEKFMPDPPYQWVWDGPASKRMVIDPEARIELILQSEGMSERAFISHIVEKANRKIESRRKHSESLTPLLHALAGALMGPAAQDMRVHFQHCEKFDGLKVSLGMSADDVNNLFGDPFATQESESGTRRLYGSKVGDVRSPYRPVLVEFTDDQVRRVFGSIDFIDIDHYLGPPSN